MRVQNTSHIVRIETLCPTQSHDRLGGSRFRIAHTPPHHGVNAPALSKPGRLLIRLLHLRHYDLCRAFEPPPANQVEAHLLDRLGAAAASAAEPSLADTIVETPTPL